MIIFLVFLAVIVSLFCLPLATALGLIFLAFLAGGNEN